MTDKITIISLIHNEYDVLIENLKLLYETSYDIIDSVYVLDHIGLINCWKHDRFFIEKDNKKYIFAIHGRLRRLKTRENVDFNYSIPLISNLIKTVSQIPVNH